MDRKDLIRLYLEAETTSAQEQELAASFASLPPRDDEEKAVCEMLQAVKPLPVENLPEAEDEFDRIVTRPKVRRYYTWGLALPSPQ